MQEKAEKSFTILPSLSKFHHHISISFSSLEIWPGTKFSYCALLRRIDIRWILKRSTETRHDATYVSSWLLVAEAEAVIRHHHYGFFEWIERKQGAVEEGRTIGCKRSGRSFRSCTQSSGRDAARYPKLILEMRELGRSSTVMVILLPLFPYI